MYLATVTQKGQITIPNELRKKYGVKLRGKVKLEAFGDHIRVSSAEDILDLAGTMKPRTKKNALKAREEMEKEYFRK